MIEEPITATERRQLLNKLSVGVFLGLVFLIIPLVIGLSFSFDHFNNFLPFIIFKYLCVGIWLYFACKLLIRAIVFYGYLFRGKVKKVTAEFIVTKKEILKVSNDNFSDTWYCYIFVHSPSAKKDFRLEIERNDHEQIQTSDTLALTYFSHWDYLVVALHRNRKLAKASIVNKTKAGFFKK